MAMSKMVKPRNRRAVFREDWTMERLAEMPPPYSVRHLAEHLLVGPNTIYRWMDEHDVFRARVRELRGEADDRVEEALYKRAIGYDVDMERVEGEDAEVVKIKHIPGDVRAQQVWLRSRRPDEWRDTVKVEISTKHTELMEHAMSVLDLTEDDYEEIIREQG